MRLDKYAFGSVEIDGQTYENDVLIDRGEVRKRKKKLSRPYRDRYGHTPLSVDEDIPWKCRTLIVGTGEQGALPVMKAVEREAERRDVKLVTLKTPDAIALLNKASKGTNAVLHLTC